MTIHLAEKILTNDYFYDIKWLFDNLLTIENEIEVILTSKNENGIYDENNHEYQMLWMDESMVNFWSHWYEDFEKEIEKKDLMDLLYQYENILNNIFIVFNNWIDQIKDKKLDSIKNFYSVNLEKINLNNVWFQDKENLALFMDNPYGLLYNSFVYYFEIFMNFFVDYDNAKNDLYFQSNIASNWLPINFSDIENLKLWEDNIDIKDFTIKNFISNSEGNMVNISVDHLLAFWNWYTLKWLMK